MTNIYTALGLGSNRSFKKITPPEILYEAKERLRSVLHDIRMSPIYRTKPMYVADQNDFYNAVVCGFFDGTPRELLRATQAIEAEFGRNRLKEVRRGERSLDIDIELFGDMLINEDDLHIPHALLKERQFVLIPLLEIYPESAEPISGVTYKAILQNCMQCSPQGVTLWN